MERTYAGWVQDGGDRHGIEGTSVGQRGWTRDRGDGWTTEVVLRDGGDGWRMEGTDV